MTDYDPQFGYAFAVSVGKEMADKQGDYEVAERLARKMVKAKGTILRWKMTYRELLARLQELTDQQLDQPVQVNDPSAPDSIHDLLPILGIRTVWEWGFYGARSSVDNKYHAEEVVLLSDYNGFAKDGAIAYEMDADEGPGEQLLSKRHPIYGKDGPTDQQDQISPEYRSRKEHMEEIGNAGCDIETSNWQVQGPR